MTSTQTGTHAQQMDQIYGGLQRHIYDFTRKYYLLGRDRLIKSLAVGEGDTVLEVGCGTARNTIIAARHFPKVTFFGFDISNAMLASANKSVSKAGLSNRIALTHGDAANFAPDKAFGIKAFDQVFCSYTLSMIPDWQETIRNSLSLVAQGGRLNIVDFGDQHGLPRLFRKALHNWLAKFQVTPRTNLASFCKALAAEHNMICNVQRPYRGYAIMITIAHDD